MKGLISYVLLEIVSLARDDRIVVEFSMIKSLTALFTREGSGFVALCPEIDVASQGDSVEDAKRNLVEAVELFFECASPSEISQRMSSESFISSLEVEVA